MVGGCPRRLEPAAAWELRAGVLSWFFVFAGHREGEVDDVEGARGTEREFKFVIWLSIMLIDRAINKDAYSLRSDQAN